MTWDPLAPRPATLLVICRGNLIRSPLAAAVLRRQLVAGGRGDLHVASAGLQIEPDSEISEEMARVAHDQGVDLSEHRPRAVTAQGLAEAGLVVTMTEDQRAAVERLERAVVARTFTLRELVRLLGGDGAVPPDSWNELAMRAHRCRPLVAPASAPEDIPDPVGRDLTFHRSVAVDIVRLCGRLASTVMPRATMP